MIPISKSFIALTGFFTLCSSLVATPAFAVAALCSQWDVSGSWHAVQSTGMQPELNLEQTGTQFRGSAQFVYLDESSSFSADITVSGPIVGTVTGNSFEATVYWDDNAIGIYTGQIGPQGLIVGRTYDKNNPKNAADWHSDRAANCRSDKDSTAQPPVALGRVQGRPAPPPERIGNEPMICAQARSARARNSPVAPQLEAECQKAGGSFTDREVTQAPSGIRARNALAISRVGIPASLADMSPANAPPANAPPPAEAPRMPDDRGMPGKSFAPPLFDDGVQVWACASAEQASKKAGACNGMKAGKQFCRTKGHSGELQQHRDGASGVTVAPARAGIPVRATNGDVCTADNCAVVSELGCAP